jgi:nitrate reductase assembly molybdenum cofactor insertion protein NarJ
METKQIETLARKFSLASMLASYPDADVEATCKALGAALGEHAGPAALAQWLHDHDGCYDELRGRYIELFDSGKGRVSLYGTEYGRMRATSKGPDLADLSGFYRAFGFVLDEASDGAEMLDHVAVQLEFYALMLAKYAHLVRETDFEGAGIVLDATKKFLNHHLGAFAPALAARMRTQSEDGYGAFFGWVGELVSAECERLQVSPKPLDYFAEVELEEGPRCAPAHSLPVIH